VSHQVVSRSPAGAGHQLIVQFMERHLPVSSLKAKTAAKVKKIVCSSRITRLEPSTNSSIHHIHFDTRAGAKKPNRLQICFNVSKVLGRCAEYVLQLLISSGDRVGMLFCHLMRTLTMFPLFVLSIYLQWLLHPHIS